MSTEPRGIQVMMRDVEDRLHTLAAMWRKEEAAEIAVNAGKSQLDENPFAAGRASALGHCAAQIEALAALAPQVVDREGAIRAAALVMARNDIEPESDYTLGLYREEAAEITDAIIAMLGNGASQTIPSAGPAGSAPIVGAPLEKGPVQILCEEIDFDFDLRLERADVLVAFVRELVSEVSERRHIASHIERLGGPAPSEGSAEVLALAEAMLSAPTDHERVKAAEIVHDACWRLNPEDAYPTDHLIDMLSSCASAVRFGLESPCHSRHAAEAANHVWKQVYGVSRFDRNTPSWEKEWARGKLISALIGMLPPLSSGSPSLSPSEASAGNPATDEPITERPTQEGDRR